MICVKLHYGLLMLRAVQWYSKCLFYAYFNISSTPRDDCAVQQSSIYIKAVFRILVVFRVIMSLLSKHCPTL